MFDEIFEAAFFLQVIKMYAWEKPFQLVVNAARAYEMSALKKSIFIRSVFLGFMLFTERLIMFVTILTLILWNQKMISATTVSCILKQSSKESFFILPHPDYKKSLQPAYK